MKKKELKKRIEDGFSQLAPDMFEAVMEAAEEENIVWSQADSRQCTEQEKRKIKLGYVASFCTCLAMICVCILGIFTEKQNHVYMVMDINPSIKVEVNEFRQVENLTGLNQDGKDVVKELKWKKRESVQELLDVLLQNVVEKSYLRDNEGILVTLSASRQDVCENLERALGEGIDRKLTELKVSGVTTAFRQVKSSPGKEGRKLLETELVKCSDLDEKQAQQLSVRELIQYCQDYTSLDLKLSEASNKEQPQQKKEETQGAVSSADGEAEKQEHKKADDKKQEEKKAEQKGTEQKEPEESKPGQMPQKGESEQINIQDETGSGNTEVQNGKKNIEEGSCKQETPGNTGEQQKTENNGNQESMKQPEHSEGQIDVPKSDNSEQPEEVQDSGNAEGQDPPEEIDKSEGQDTNSKLENSEVQNTPPKSESPGGQDTSFPIDKEVISEIKNSGEESIDSERDNPCRQSLPSQLVNSGVNIELLKIDEFAGHETMPGRKKAGERNEAILSGGLEQTECRKEQIPPSPRNKEKDKKK